MKNKSLKTAYAVIMIAIAYMVGFYLYDMNSGKTARYCNATVAMVKSACKNGAITIDERRTMVYYVNSGLHTAAYRRAKAREVRGMVERAYVRQSNRQESAAKQLQSYKP